MRLSTVFTLTASIFAAGTTAITGAEGVAEFQKLQTATTEYNNQLSRVNEETGLLDGYRASIGLIVLQKAFAACITKFKEGVSPDPNEIPKEVSHADADLVLEEAKKFLSLLGNTIEELNRVHDLQSAAPHHYDIQHGFEPLISRDDSSLASISGNLQIWFPIDKWTATENLFNPSIAGLPPVQATFQTL